MPGSLLPAERIGSSNVYISDFAGGANRKTLPILSLGGPLLTTVWVLFSNE